MKTKKVGATRLFVIFFVLVSLLFKNIAFAYESVYDFVSDDYHEDNIMHEEKHIYKTEDTEEYEEDKEGYVENSLTIPYNDSGIVPINSSFRISSWEELRNAIEDGVTEILLTEDIFIGGAAIIIPFGADVMLSSDGGTFILTQEMLNQRHFILEPESTLRLENIVISGISFSEYPANTLHGGITVNGGHLILGNGAEIANCRPEGNVTGPMSAVVRVQNGGSLSMHEGSAITGTPITASMSTPRGLGVRVVSGSTFTMYGGTISNHQAHVGATIFGGGVCISDADSVFHMHGGTIRDNLVQSGGGGVLVENGGAFHMMAGDIVNNTALRTTSTNALQNGGGGVLVRGEGSVFTMSGPLPKNITGNIANRVHNDSEGGAGVFVGNHAQFTMDGNSNIVDNIAGISTTGDGQAGGVAMRQGSVFIMNDGKISQNIGHGVFNIGGTFNFNGGNIGGLTVEEGNSGAGVLVGSARHSTSDNILGGTFTMQDGTRISGNGGRGVFLRTREAMFTMHGGIIGGEGEAGNRGGGVQVGEGATVMGTGGTRSAGGSVFNMQAGEIIGNSATNGGGVLVTHFSDELHSTFNMHSGEITNNTASTRGGGVLVENTAVFNMYDETIISGNRTNSATSGTHGNGGGGVAIVGTFGSQIPSVFNMYGGTIGGLNEGEGNISAGIGGGVFVQAASLFTMYGGQILGNTSQSTGTGSASAGGGGGGGVHVNNANARFVMEGGLISENTAIQSGGGIRVDLGGSFEMHSGSITRNQANATAVTQGGGGVFVTNTSSFIMAGTEDKLISENTSLNGGGVHIANGAPNFVMGEGSIIENNTTPQEGAATGIGVRISNGEFTMNGGIIRNNNRPLAATGVSNGGGVFVTGNGSIFTMNNGEISGHNASQSGGGVHVATSSEFVMNSGTITRNTANGITATQGGGGVYVTSSGRFYMHSGVISENSSQLNGGGVFVNAGSAISPSLFTMTDDSTEGMRIIENNIAPNGAGVRLAGTLANGTSPQFVMEGNSVIRNNTTLATGNVAGMGVNVTGGTLTMNSGFIEDNLRPQNSTGMSSGGGVFLTSNNSRFLMNGGRISGHEVSESGGGVFVGPSAGFNFEGGTVTENTALSVVSTQGGGGVFVAQGTGTTEAARTDFTMGDGADIYNNQALNGGGVHLVGTSTTTAAGTSNTNFIMNGGSIAQNTTPEVHDELAASGIGVRVSGGFFEMNDGEISENQRTGEGVSNGGGIFITNNIANNSSRLDINAGEIKGNIASDGGGLFYATENVLNNTIINSSAIFTNNVAINGVRVDNNVAYSNQSRISPSITSLEWFEASYSNPENFVRNSHAFTNYDINTTTGSLMWRITYSHEGSGSITSPVQSDSLVLEGTEVEFIANYTPPHNVRWVVGTREHEVDLENNPVAFNFEDIGDYANLKREINAHTHIIAIFEMINREIVITVDQDGNETITLPPIFSDIDYNTIEDESGNIVITFPSEVDESDITVNIPPLWSYTVGTDENGYVIVTIAYPSTGDNAGNISDNNNKNTEDAKNGSITIDVSENRYTEVVLTEMYEGTEYKIDDSKSASITVTFPPNTNKNNITVNVPYGWTFAIAISEVSKEVIVTITPPSDAGMQYEPNNFGPYWPSQLTDETLPQVASAIERDKGEHYAFIVGFDDKTVRPDAATTRAQAATTLFRLMSDSSRERHWKNSNSFHDVHVYNWFNNAISTVTNAGIFAGMPDGGFHPNREITRAEMAAALVRFTGKKPITNTLIFSDTTGHWGEGYINTAASMGWVFGDTGIGGKFRPDETITRAEMAAIINRVLNRLLQGTEDLLPNRLIWFDNKDPISWYYIHIQEATNSHRYRMKDDDIHEQWIELTPNRDWTILEKPYSQPEDILK